MRGGYRPNAGRVSAFGRGVRLQARTLRMPDECWDQLDALARELRDTPAAIVARLLENGSAVRDALTPK